MLVTSVTLVQYLIKILQRSVKLVITAPPVLNFQFVALKPFTTQELVQLTPPTVSLAKLDTTASTTIVFPEFALRVTSAVRRLKNQCLASRALSTLTRSRNLKMTASYAQLVPLATKRVSMTGFATCAQLVTTAHVSV
jgi:hypothetical protein